MSRTNRTVAPWARRNLDAQAARERKAISATGAYRKGPRSPYSVRDLQDAIAREIERIER